MAINTTNIPVRSSRPQSSTGRKAAGRNSQTRPTDDEILGLVTTVPSKAAGGKGAPDSGSPEAGQSGASRAGEATAAEATPAGPNEAPSELAPIFEEHPELRQAWDAAQAYQAVFVTPAAARDAKQQLDELDAMFFSAKPADHAALAARIHELSPEAFHGLANAMQGHAARLKMEAGSQQSFGAQAGSGHADEAVGAKDATSSAVESSPNPVASEQQAEHDEAATSSVRQRPMAAQQASDPQRVAKATFFHDTNAAAVEQILGAIHSQVDRLLPDSIAANTRNRIVGEIYRELDATLRANRQLGNQLREAFQSGAGDATHQRTIVALVAGRARQILPAVAKRVIGEWTQSIVAGNRERLGRHEAASKRVDIAGAGPSDGVNRKPVSPRDINYRKLSDADILNL